MQNIDYVRIGKAVEYYQACGYTYVEVPWLVSQEAQNLGKPFENRGFETFKGYLVASGEQSFYTLLEEEKLAPGKYVCVTPCFRDEQELNNIVRQYFLKVELIDTETVDEESLARMIRTAENFLGGQCAREFINQVETPEGMDLYLGEIEIGSYGVREVGRHRWIYGTGLAEPRFSEALICAES